MSKGNLHTEGERKKQAGELVKNADKLLKGGDPTAAYIAAEQALLLDPGNLYAQAYKERIKSVLVKSGLDIPTVTADTGATTAPPVVPVPPPLQAEKPIEPQPKVEVQKPPVVAPVLPEPAKEKPAPVRPEPQPTAKLRKLAAIMFTDMVGYTTLTQTNESLAVHLIETQQKIIRPIFKKNDGTEIKTVGDAFLAEFVSVLNAVRAAIEIQQALREHNLKSPKENQIQLRIGIHLGDIIYKDNDIYGDGVNIASRIQSQADPGAVFISQDVYNQIRNRDEFIIEYIGEIELKNIISPIPIYKVLTETEKRQKEQDAALKVAVKEGIQEAQTKKISEYLSKAKELSSKGALQEALLEVTKILQLSPQHPEARLIESQIRNKRIEIIGKQIEETRALPREDMLVLYEEALTYARKEGDLSRDELDILASWRAELHLTEKDHEELLARAKK